MEKHPLLFPFRSLHTPFHIPEIPEIPVQAAGGYWWHRNSRRPGPQKPTGPLERSLGELPNLGVLPFSKTSTRLMLFFPLKTTNFNGCVTGYSHYVSSLTYNFETNPNTYHFVSCCYIHLHHTGMIFPHHHYSWLLKLDYAAHCCLHLS